MNNKSKLALLSLILFFPVVAFLFLSSFGENQYDLEVFSPTVAHCEPNTVDGVHRVPDFSLTDQDGKGFAWEGTEGKVVAVDFIFTRCPSTCVEMTSGMRRVQESLKGNPYFEMVSISVDPGHDSPEVLAEYAKINGADTKSWHFLTGEKEGIYQIARCNFFIVAKTHEADPNDFIHSNKIVLIDQDNRIRGYYDGTDRDEIDRLIVEAQLLLHQKKQI